MKDPAPLQPLAVSIGDPAGIGAEVVAKSWERRREEGLPPFFAVGDVSAVEAVWKGPIAVIGEPAGVFDHFDHALPLIRVAGGETIPGRPTLEGARNALDSLEFAVGLTRSGAAAAVVTGPVTTAAAAPERVRPTANSRLSSALRAPSSVGLPGTAVSPTTRISGSAWSK